MATIEVSEDALRRAASGEVFARAVQLVDAGKVGDLRAGGTVMSAIVAGIPVSVRILADGIEGRCECVVSGGGPCAHAAAAALAWVREGEDEDAPDLYSVLRLQSRDWLASRLADLAAGDPVLTALLLAESAEAESSEAVADLRGEFDEVLDELEEDAAEQGEYAEWYPDCDALDELIEGPPWLAPRRASPRSLSPRRQTLNPELVERVAELRGKGRTPKEIARALGLKPADVAPLIRAVGAASPRREAPLAGCWVTDHWADKMAVSGHPDWPGMSAPEAEAGESGLVGVLVARDTGSTVAACGFLVDVWCLGVKDTNGPKTMDRRKLPDFVRLFFSAWQARPPVPAPLELARHVVFGAVDYARGMGFEPHPDFARGAVLLGDWEEGTSDVTFGWDGKPMYINGPRDNTYGTMAKLRRTAGDGNFDYLIQFPGPVG